jgi:hypothetical protein
MEDASAVDLDWFWKGWFYSTDFVDIGIKNVKQYYVTESVTKENKESFNRRGRRVSGDQGPTIYLLPEDSADLKAENKKAFNAEEVQSLNEFLNKKYTAEERKNMKNPKFFYEVEFDKPGGMIMPIIAELQFEDGTSEVHKFPAQIWRRNNEVAKRTFATDKKVVKIVVDPKLETADIDTTNNTWPKQETTSKFDQLEKK